MGGDGAYASPLVGLGDDPQSLARMRWALGVILRIHGLAYDPDAGLRCEATGGPPDVCPVCVVLRRLV